MKETVHICAHLIEFMRQIGLKSIPPKVNYEMYFAARSAYQSTRLAFGDTLDGKWTIIL